MRTIGTNLSLAQRTYLESQLLRLSAELGRVLQITRVQYLLRT